ncbi:MAG: hypothetical protein FWD06_09330 [Oscillospiraceae bacterium]|nr:hypothetical protein [Oscillospiraceae bacterium]
MAKRMLAVILAVVLAAGAFSIAASAQTVNETWRLTTNLQVRNGANTTASSVGTLNSGTVVRVDRRVTQNNHVWVRISAVTTRTGGTATNAQAAGRWVAVRRNSPNATNFATQVQNQNQVQTINETWVLTANLQVRNGSNTTFGSVGTLNSGTVVRVDRRVTQNNHVWVRISAVNSRAGGTATNAQAVGRWIAIRRVSPNAANFATQVQSVNQVWQLSSALQVRNGPNTSFSSVGTLNRNTTVRVDQRVTFNNHVWVRVSAVTNRTGGTATNAQATGRWIAVRRVSPASNFATQQ